MILVPIDFEFKRSQDPDLDLVCCCFKYKEQTKKIWLYNDDLTKKKLADLFRAMKNDCIFISYSIIAECRSFMSLGLHPDDFKWIDVMIAHRLEKNQPRNDMKKDSLLQCCFRNDVTHRYAEEKTEIIDMILNTTDYSEEQRTIIMDYCSSDIEPLIPLYNKISDNLKRKYRYENTERTLLNLSEYCVSNAYQEQIGLPVDVEALNNLMDNYQLATSFFIDQCTYPFYQWKNGRYTFKYEVFADYIESSGSAKLWQLTDKGKFRYDEDFLSKMSVNQTLKSLHDARKMESKLRYTNPNKKTPGIKAAVGSDNRLRASLNPFGTCTGRNAPKTSQFIFGMPTVFRCLIRPEPGKDITCIDWSAEEFLIAAVLSNDKNMISAYKSGDPYAWFAITCGAGNNDGTVDVMMREAFKSSVLGLLYGMGRNALQLKLIKDTGKNFTVEQTEDLINKNHTIFSMYWTWVSTIDDACRHNIPLRLNSGWAVTTNDNFITSYRNWPIQATGAYMLQYVCVEAMRQKIPILAGYHDCVYFEHPSGDEFVINAVKNIMTDAERKILGMLARKSVKTYNHDTPWIDKKGKSMYEDFKKFLTKNPDIDIGITHKKVEELL